MVPTSSSDRSAVDLHAGEEKSNFELRRFMRVRSMHGIEFNVGPMRGANGPLLGLGRIGGAHQLTVLLDGIIALQDKNDGRPGRHKGAEAVEKWSCFVHGVKPFSDRLSHLYQFHGNGLQTSLFITTDDVADRLFLDGVRLDDRERTFTHA